MPKEISSSLISNLSVSDIIAALSAVVAVISAVFAFFKSISAKKSEKKAKEYAENANATNLAAKEYYEYESRPFVDIVVEMRKNSIGFVVKNPGKMTAHDVKLILPDEFVKKLKLNNIEKTCMELLPNNKYTLLPDKELFIVFCYASENYNNIKDDCISVVATYEDYKGNTYSKTVEFNFEAYLWFHVNTTKSDFRILNENIGKLTKAVEKISKQREE